MVSDVSWWRAGLEKLTDDCPEILILILIVVLLKQRQVHSPIIKQLQLVIKYDFFIKESGISDHLQ